MMPLLSLSWLHLKPNTVEYLNPENFNDYIDRIRLIPEFNNIPESVFKQWIHPHHSLHQTIKNYAWFDYYFVEFKLEKFSTNDLFEIYIVEDFRELVEIRVEESDSIEGFFCTEEDKEYWKKEGTWRTPPIILNCNSVNNAPKWAEISSNYQLAEGHNRMGYLKALKNLNLKINEFHEVWVLTLI